MEGSNNTRYCSHGTHNQNHTHARGVSELQNEHEAACLARYPAEIIPSIGDHDSCISSITRELPDLHTPRLYPSRSEQEVVSDEVREDDIPASFHETNPDTLTQLDDRIRIMMKGNKSAVEKLSIVARPAKEVMDSRATARGSPNPVAASDGVSNSTNVGKPIDSCGPSGKLGTIFHCQDSGDDKRLNTSQGCTDNVRNGSTLSNIPLSAPGAYHVPGRPICLRRSGTATNRSPLQVQGGQDEEGNLNMEMALEACVVEPSETASNRSGSSGWRMEDKSDNNQNSSTRARSSAKDNSPLELIEGKAMPEKEPTRRRGGNRTTLYLIAFAFVTLMVAALVFILSTTRDKGKSESSSSTSDHEPTGPPTELSQSIIYYPPFRDDIPITLRNKISEEGSPVSLANIWMVHDPLLETYSKERQLQRFSLVSLYYSTGGSDSWINKDHWLDYEMSECLWYTSHQTATTTCNDQNQLLILDLHSNNLTGPMTGLGSFYPKLQVLNLGHNNLAGTLPPMTSGMSDLEVFVMSNNGLYGNLAGDAGFTAFKIRVIQMDGNHFGGYINPVFEYVPQMEVLNLTNNEFQGKIATEFAFTTKLTYLGLSNNQYTGLIPTELGVLSRLSELHVAGNPALHGSIPSQLGLLVDNLKVLDVSRTDLTGEIPSSLCDHRQQQDNKKEDTDDPVFQYFANCTLVNCCTSSNP